MGPVSVCPLSFLFLEIFFREVKKLLLLFQFSRKFFLKMKINVYPKDITFFNTDITFFNPTITTCRLKFVVKIL